MEMLLLKGQGSNSVSLNHLKKQFKNIKKTQAKLRLERIRKR
jgi:hypothetical protein